MTHAIPIDDQKDHKKTVDCQCNPTITILENEDIMVVHYAFDRREEHE